MSISNLLVPNDLDIFANSLTANTLNVTNESINTLNVSVINGNPPGTDIVMQTTVYNVDGSIFLPPTTANQKLVLYNTFSGTTSFFGFGVNASTLRYEVDQTTSDHVFYAGTGFNTSIELLRIKGNGGGVVFPSVGAVVPA